MLFGSAASSECSQVSALAGLRILLARVEAVFAGFQLAYHACPQRVPSVRPEQARRQFSPCLGARLYLRVGAPRSGYAAHGLRRDIATLVCQGNVGDGNDANQS